MRVQERLTESERGFGDLSKPILWKNDFLRVVCAPGFIGLMALVFSSVAIVEALF